MKYIVLFCWTFNFILFYVWFYWSKRWYKKWKFTRQMFL